MAKRLSIEQIEQMKSMVQQGIAPEDISREFNIAVSSVHNYKARFKEEGMKFPVVRGKRPSHGKVTPEPPQVTGVVNRVPGENFKFIVNGMSVEITGQAKAVNINKDSFEVKF